MSVGGIDPEAPRRELVGKVPARCGGSSLVVVTVR